MPNFRRSDSPFSGGQRQPEVQRVLVQQRLQGLRLRGLLLHGVQRGEDLRGRKGLLHCRGEPARGVQPGDHLGRRELCRWE